MQHQQGIWSDENEAEEFDRAFPYLEKKNYRDRFLKDERQEINFR